MSWIIVGALGVAGAALAYKYWPRSREAKYEHRLRELYADMAGRGLSPLQQSEELAFRRAMAVLRRKASGAVKTDPTGQIRETISRIAVEVAKTVSDKDVARRFLKVVQDAPLSDILYKDALRAVAYARRRTMTAREPTDDDIAAVTTR